MNVVVIGGGVIGYSIAHALAERGTEVHVVDMRGPGGGATQASAGMLAPYIEGHSETLRRLGVSSLSLYDDFIHRLDSGAAQVTEYCRSGTLQATCSPAGAEELSRAAANLQGRGVAHSLLTGDEVRTLEPMMGPAVLSGLLVPTHGYVHVAQLMTALTRASYARGVTSQTDRVVRIEHGAHGMRVTTQHSIISATVAVVAAGSWSGQLTMPGSRSIPVRPIRGQSIELAFSAPPVSRVVWGDGCYLVPWRNGSVILGGTVEDVGFNESATAEGVKTLRQCAEATLPSVRSAHVRDVRVGLRPATVDELPLIGWSSTMRGVCLATGHYRNGILLAPLTAKLVAEIVLGAEDRETQWVRDAVAPSRLGL